MSKEDSFGFTHLEEDDGDNAADIGTPQLDINLQPHLGSPNRNSYESSGGGNHQAEQEHAWQHSSMGGIDNLGMDLGEGEGHIVSKISSERGSPDSQTNSSSQNSQGNNVNRNGMTSSQSHVNDSVARVENGGPEVSPAGIQVQYSNTDGKVHVMQGQVVTRPDGSRYIDTQGIPQQSQWSEAERPLTQRRMRFLKIFSIASCIFFFPLGIPAAYFAFKTEKEFHAGIMRGNIDTAQKYAKRCERFTIMAFIMSVVVAALVVAVIERPYYTDSSAHRGTVVG